MWVRLGAPICTKRESPLVLRVLLQEPFHPQHAFHDALGVVQAVHAETHVERLHADFLQQRRLLLMRVGLLLLLGDRGHDNADGKRPHHGHVVAAIHVPAVPLDARFQDAVHGLQEIVAVRLDMEPDQVRSQQSVEQLALPRTDAERFRVRPRDMPEHADARVRTALLDHPRQQREVIVLHDHDRLLHVAHLVPERVGELLVDALVLLKIGGAKDRPGMRDMAKRP